ncbi:phospholipid-transporting ATPase [Penicillium macrosclerotiorum]|uniref:phospholipid-transporting ATPase n=1 Tax=Penicillium macrosclerotiorum TaxID=303699 RepID=UPI0025478666|nr:phospholipid-transporting ATPase [Penicillium macrosclerotiorum]KAJ5669043.1 phospholipid-transporting ATPase [Penicillium macrosclerotiorum]
MASGRPPGSHPAEYDYDEDLRSLSPGPIPANDPNRSHYYSNNPYAAFVGNEQPAEAHFHGEPHTVPGGNPIYSSYDLRPSATNTSFQSRYDSDYERAEYPEQEHLQQPSNRNSVFALGSGFWGQVKNAVGVKPPDYDRFQNESHPLTEGGAGVYSTGDAPAPRGERKKFRASDIISVFGRRKVDPSTLGPRMIQLNNPPANATHKFVSNHVSTAKYNVITFIPKFLFEQFSKYANLFFLFTAVLQQIPNVSPTNKYTTVVPLGIVLLVSAIKELVEDYKRRTSDRGLNYSKTQILKGSSFHETKWVDVAVGDIVRVESEQPFPADLVLLASSEPEGLCYIETANLDGETNLKIKQAIPETANLVSPSDLSRLSGRVRSEQPNSSLYTYEATLTMNAGTGEKELSLAPDQLLLRGATLRNTPWIHGIVVFTGHETKLMRNATATPIKRTAVERMVNIQILMLVSILIALSVISSVGDLVVRQTASSKLAYLDYGSTNAVKQFFMDIFTYWVLYSNLVPISLFVTIEIVKYFQAYLINSDLDIYYDKTDTPATCRTSSLVEELGQIEYIFSDKTGTLTCNMMEFKECSIAGIQYGDDVSEDRRATVEDGTDAGVYDFKTLRQNLQSHPTQGAIQQFLTLLATCHTVIPERTGNDPDQIKYQAASPDEGALVDGAASLGYRFTNRKPRSVIFTANGVEQEYELLAVCEFNSTRKRMSTIFRCPDGKVRIYCKGADTVIFERLMKDPPFKDETIQHLEEYASDGLRTLCLAMREVPDDEFQQWYQIFDKANTTVGGNRAEELDKAAELIERDFYLLGATAIEDRLQDGVPDTIHTLQTAGIKIWVLTGDRQETAINIGMSCKLISEDMSLVVINKESTEETRQALQKNLEEAKVLAGQHDAEPLALVIDGKSLTFALEKDLEKLFLDLAVMCKAVICCRVSPLQKALVVKLVKRHKKSLLLAIGDGANDVSMIQAAHVGVGISGVEGLQAARSADVAIGQFRFLRKLLLVHGSWSYSRISRVILYSFYKNITLYMTQFWYSFQNAFSGEVIYESWTLSYYNVLFTVMPPFAMGIFDQYISARLLDRYPQLYQLGQQGIFFKKHSFWAWILNGFFHSLLLYIVSELIFFWDLPMSDGKTAGHWVWGEALYTAVLATVLGKAALISNIWNKYTFIAIPGSMALWIAFLPAYGYAAPAIGFSTEYYGTIPVLFKSPIFYLMAIALPCICLMRDFAWKYAKRMYYPQNYHHVQEIQKYNVQDYRPRMEQFQKAVRKARQSVRTRKQRGYAFSQADDGGQMRVLNAYDTTQGRGRYGEMTSSRNPAF